MKKGIINSVVIFALLFSSCTVEADKTNETKAMPEIIDSATEPSTFIESDSVPDTIIETIPPEETSEITLTFTEETTSEQKVSAAVSEETLATSASVPDYNDIPMLTVSNIDYSSNKLEWTSVEGAQSYVLYLLNEQSGEFDEYGEVKSTSCNDKKLLPNTKYTYKVAARFSYGSVGGMSEKASVYTPNRYGNHPNNYDRMAFQGEWLYYITQTQEEIRKINIYTGEDMLVTGIADEESACQLNAVGDYLYYTVDFLDDNYDNNEAIYKIRTDGSDKKAVFKKEDLIAERFSDDTVWGGPLVIGDRMYIIICESVHEEVPDIYMARIINAENGEILLWRNGDTHGGIHLIDTDTDTYDIVLGAEEIQLIFYDDENYSRDWDLVRTGNYNISKISHDLNTENITTEYSGDVVYYSDSITVYINTDGILCAYDNTAKNFSEISDKKVVKAFYDNNVFYYFTEDGEFIKNENGSGKKLFETEAYCTVNFYDRYIIYENMFEGSRMIYNVIDTDGNIISENLKIPV